MSKCASCGKSYWAYEEDAGTYKESYCSDFCEKAMEEAISAYIDDGKEDLKNDQE